ncbi:cytochrome c oxidase assembly factor CtaG [Metabacillus herbersteinensis]|uniref:Cytochrome c oxidase assembly factor CtaG n=1 Tax=Metabacillus herbersteinensis TaxID=283816 RepID=A0ABV6GQ13_9BACI
MGFEIFGFRALWSPYFFIFVALVTVFYFVLIGPWRAKFTGSEPVSRKTKLLFVSAMILLYISKGSPVDLLGHIMFSAHMTQMAILYLVIPPLLVVGIPVWLWRSIIYRPVIKPIFTFLTKPLIALIIFNGVFSLYHIPLVFDFVKTAPIYHTPMTILIFIAALLMWWPLLTQLPEWNSLTGIKKVGYIFADGVLLTPACALIIFATDPLYLTYSEPQAWINALHLCVPSDMLASLSLTGPDMFNTLPLVEDQQLGGVVMKIIQEIVYGTILGFIFFQWARREREQDELEAVSEFTPNPVK